MSNRIAIISRCDHCPHFDNLYYMYNKHCKLLDRQIKSVWSDEVDMTIHKIPRDCPLQKTKETVDDSTVEDKG